MSKVKHKIYIQYNDDIAQGLKYVIEQAVLATLQFEKVDMSCSVSILITDDKTIHEYNLKYRGIDKATDVLSFPMQEFDASGWVNHGDLDYDENSDELPLGDIILSMESVIRQAEEYANTVGYEVAYLIIHSSLHLLGYDHDNDESEKIMHQKTKNIIKEMGIKFE